MYQNRLFFAVVLTVAGVFTSPSMSAPTIKKIGDATNSNLLNKDTQVRLPLSNQRASSLRLSGATTKSASKLSDNKNGAKTSYKPANAAGSARLSGLHGNLFKGLGSKISSSVSSQPGGGDSVTTDLTQRVIDLEAAIVTKQENLEAGNGISITNNTISLTDEMATLPDKIDTINQDIDDLNEKIEAAGLSDEYYTKEQVDSIISQLSDMNIVDTFVEEDFLQLVQGHTPKGQP